MNKQQRIIEHYSESNNRVEMTTGDVPVYKNCVNYDFVSLAKTAEWEEAAQVEAHNPNLHLSPKFYERREICALYGEMRCENCPLCKNLDGSTGFYPMSHQTIADREVNASLDYIRNVKLHKHEEYAKIVEVNRNKHGKRVLPETDKLI